MYTTIKKIIIILLLLISYIVEANCSINWRRFLPGPGIGIGISIIFGHKQTTSTTPTPPVTNALLSDPNNTQLHSDIGVTDGGILLKDN